jgi:hypothetical protein
MKIPSFTNPQLFLQSLSRRKTAVLPQVSTPSFSDRLSLTTKDSRSLSTSYGPQAQLITQPAPYGKTKLLPDANNFSTSQLPLSDETKTSPIGIVPQPPSDETKTSPIGIVPQPTPGEKDTSLVTTYTPSTVEIQSTEDYWTLERMQQAKPMPMPTAPLLKNLISDNEKDSGQASLADMTMGATPTLKQ